MNTPYPIGSIASRQLSHAASSADALAKLRQLAGRRPGWKNGRGVPPSEGMVNRAEAFIQLYRLLDVVDIDVFASEDGEAMVTAYLNEFYLESNLELDGSVIVVEEIVGETSPGETFGCDRDAFFYIGQRVNSVRLAREQELCGWLEYSHSTTLTSAAVNSITMPLRILQINPGCRYFAPLALNAKADQFAHTWKSIIDPKRVTHRSFGNSTRQFSKNHLRQNKAVLKRETTATLLCET